MIKINEVKKAFLPFIRERNNTAALTDIDGTALGVKSRPDLVELSKNNQTSFIKLTDIYNSARNSYFGFVTGRALIDVIYIIMGIKRDEDVYRLSSLPFDNKMWSILKKKISNKNAEILSDAYYNTGYGMEILYKGKYESNFDILKLQNLYKEIIKEANLPKKVFLEPKGPIFAVHFREIVESGIPLKEITRKVHDSLIEPAEKRGISLIEREMVIELWPKNAKKVSKREQIKKLSLHKSINKLVFGGDTSADKEGIIEIRDQIKKGNLKQGLTFFVMQKHNLGFDMLNEIHTSNYHHFVFKNVKEAEMLYSSLSSNHQ